MKQLESIFLPSPSGLYNTGSICYFNSLLQVLASCTCLHHWKSKSKNKLQDEFEKFIQNSKNLDPMTSTKLLNVLREYNPKFGHGQESASEALTLLLNTIDDNQLNNLFMHRFKYIIKCNSCGYTSDKIMDHSILFELFHIKEVNVKNMLKYDISLTDYKCEKCNNIGAEKKANLTMLPEIIICLFNVYYNKAIHLFPDTLTFPGVDKKLTYKVIGQVEHSGSLNGGHYWSRALRNNGIYLFNDFTYNESNIEPTKNTYFIIYHLID